MSERRARLERIERGGVIAVLRGIDESTVVSAGEAIVDGGITAVEVTADTGGVVDHIERLREHLADRDALVGAGTVLDAETARAVQLAGAEFIVTPSLDEGVVRTASRYGTPVIPGIMTPTEAVRAAAAGADAVKLFPASSVGPSHVAALHGPLDQIDIVPTGGISLENAGEYIEAGAMAVGVGSALLSDDISANADWEELTALSRSYVDAVEDARD